MKKYEERIFEIEKFTNYHIALSKSGKSQACVTINGSIYVKTNVLPIICDDGYWRTSYILKDFLKENEKWMRNEKNWPMNYVKKSIR